MQINYKGKSFSVALNNSEGIRKYQMLINLSILNLQFQDESRYMHIPASAYLVGMASGPENKMKC